MTETLIELSEDAFDATYPLVPNHLNPSAGWATGEGAGCLFETYGEELDFVRGQDPRTIWTLLDGDDGDLYLDGTFIQVHIEMDTETEADCSATALLPPEEY